MSGGIYDRLYTADTDGRNIYLLNDSGKMSHCCWQDNETVFGWGGAQTAINTLRKYKTIAKYFIKPLLPLYKKLVSGNSIDGTSKISSMVTGESYLFLKDKTKQVRKVPVDILDRNGHPTFSPTNSELAITDTYPDKDGVAKLLLYHADKNVVTVVDELKSIQEFDNSPNRCDLHPNWSYNGQYVAIDTMNDGCRSIYIYDISTLS